MSFLLRPSLTALLAALLCGAVVTPLRAQDKVAKAGPMLLNIEKMWKGSVPDADLLKTTPAPAYISDAKAFEALWTAWKFGDDVPEVDFKAELVLVYTTPGRSPDLIPMLSETGNLACLTIGNRDFKPGFRYVIISVKKDGVKTVNGKPLKE